MDIVWVRKSIYSMLALQGRYQDATLLDVENDMCPGSFPMFLKIYVSSVRSSTSSPRDATKLSSVTSGFDDSSKFVAFVAPAGSNLHRRAAICFSSLSLQGPGADVGKDLMQASTEYGKVLSSNWSWNTTRT